MSGTPVKHERSTSGTPKIKKWRNNANLSLLHLYIIYYKLKEEEEEEIIIISFSFKNSPAGASIGSTQAFKIPARLKNFFGGNVK